MILTKRPERIRECLQEDWFPRNVWWGVSIESKNHIGRWDILDVELHYYIPEIMFISFEPLLSSIDMLDLFMEIDIGDEDCPGRTRSPNWVIVGGESGLQARPCHPNWVRSIRDQCSIAEVPFFFKQWGEYLPLEPSPPLRSLIEVEYEKVGKEHSGAIIDGHEWREFPVGMQP